MAKLREITVSLGISIDKKGVWVKPALTLKLELDESESDPKNRKELVKRAFEIASEDLNDEIGRLLGPE